MTNGYALADEKMMKKGCAQVEEAFDLLDKNEVHNLRYQYYFEYHSPGIR